MISGKVVGKSIDANGNIKVDMEFTLTDGSKKQGVTRYNFINFTPERVQNDIKNHCESLMRKTYGLKRHQELIAQTDLTNVKYDCSNCEIVIKPEITDKDGNIVTPAERIIIDDK